MTFLFCSTNGATDSRSSEAIVLRETPTGETPQEAKELGMRYFLEVSIANEFLADWTSSQENKPSAADACARLMRYATDDA